MVANNVLRTISATFADLGNISIGIGPFLGRNKNIRCSEAVSVKGLTDTS